LDLGTDLDDFAGGLVANDVRVGHQRSAKTIQCVATLDADGFDADDDALRMTFGIGNVLIFQDLGATVFVIDCRLHCQTPALLEYVERTAMQPFGATPSRCEYADVPPRNDMTQAGPLQRTVAVPTNDIV